MAVDGEQGFAEWVRPHLPALLMVAERQVGFGHRDDVVQETLLRAWQRRDTYSADRGEVRPWLIGILLDRARRHRNRSRLFARWDERDPAASTRGVDGDPAVDEAIARLPRRQREVVVLHYLADLPVAEVAAVLGIDGSTVTSHLSAARRRMAHELGESE